MPIARLTDFQKPYMADAELEVHAEPDIYLSPMLLAKGVWEPLESQLVLGLAERSAVCVDVGANIGYYTVLCGRAMGERGVVYAFEPESRNFALLQRNAARNGLGSARLVHAAASDHEGAMALHLAADGNLGDHRLHGTPDRASTEQVRLTRLDDVLEASGHRADLMKIDVQGHEEKVLLGAARTIETSLPGLNIILEYTPTALRQAGSDPLELLRLLRGWGLEPWLVVEKPRRYRPTNYRELQAITDQLYAAARDDAFVTLHLRHQGF
jgi:FkbM family methyltransferase